jgi:CheY-like chemotaxis protein
MVHLTRVDGRRLALAGGSAAQALDLLSSVRNSFLAHRRGRARPLHIAALLFLGRAGRLGQKDTGAFLSDEAMGIEEEETEFASREPVPSSQDRPSPRPAGSMLILVVERDPHVRELEAHFLNEAGYAVEFATDGQAALERAQELLPDIVITEILVPKLDGLSLCRQLKEDPRTRGITVLVFSILAAHTRAKEAGADAFLMKPLAEHRLVGTVKTLMGIQNRVEGEERA